MERLSHAAAQMFHVISYSGARLPDNHFSVYPFQWEHSSYSPCTVWVRKRVVDGFVDWGVWCCYIQSAVGVVLIALQSSLLWLAGWLDLIILIIMCFLHRATNQSFLQKELLGSHWVQFLALFLIKNQYQELCYCSKMSCPFVCRWHSIILWLILCC